ncbi:S8 family peptidase [Bacillus testis]|uniref:S8 family peptidase n=1 Tax=Bacillus testis TaxID=1622072 RepID=UPI00067F0E90|nr:S8 family serine peptidase [Bacillus testis]
MKKYICLLLLAVLLVVLPHSHGTEAAAQQADGQSPVMQSLAQTTRVNILFNGSVDESVIEKYRLKVVHEYQSISAVTAEMDHDNLDGLRKEAAVKDVKEDQLIEAQGQKVSWGYNRLNMQNRVPISGTGKGVKIAIIDSGVDTKHPDLKIAGGACVMKDVIDYEGCTENFNDNNGHGTHVAGIIGAQNNNIGTLGIAPGASIYAVKALDSHGLGITSSIMAAMDWSIQHKMDIINLSLTTPEDDPSLRAIIAKAYNQGILIVAASGNYSKETGRTVLYPAKYPQVIGVSSMGKNSELLSTSSYGKDIELTAPGGDILSTLPIAYDDYDGAADGYGIMSGTSMAAPFVSGMAALYMEKYPELTNVQIRELLDQNAQDLGAAGKDVKFGYGLVQADTAPDTVTEVKGSASANGTVTLKVEKLPEEATQYNVYRFGRKIYSGRSELDMEDYAVKGKVEYTIVPLLNGKEMKMDAKKAVVDAASPDLKDVRNEDWYSRNVAYLYREKIMRGYSNGLIQPKNMITRTEAVVLLVNGLGLDTALPAEAPFKDLKADSFGAKQVAAAKQAGILSGFPDGTFRGQQYVTRAEMSIMLARAFSLQDEAIGTAPRFKDVNEKVTGYEQIRQLAAAGIAQGYSDGTFKPYNKIDRAAYAVFLSRALNPLLK